MTLLHAIVYTAIGFVLICWAGAAAGLVHVLIRRRRRP